MVQLGHVADTVQLPDTSNGKEAVIPSDGNAESTLPQTDGSLSRTVKHWNHTTHVALCFASRGTGHMPSAFGAFRELVSSGVPFTLCPTFYQNIPDAQNSITRLALDSKADVLWFVEDDMLLPVGVLNRMLDEHSKGYKVVTVDYKGRGAGNFIMRDADTNRVLLTPMGCLLVDRSVFDVIGDPPWQVDTIWELRRGKWFDTGRIATAGQQDTRFSRLMLQHDIEIKQVDGVEAGHLEVKEHGQHNNYGVDYVVCHGGNGELEWKPEGIAPYRQRKSQGHKPSSVTRYSVTEGRLVPMDDNDKVIYLMSQKGTVLDMVQSKARPYLKRKWTQINKAQFEKQLKVQTAHRQKRMDDQVRELQEMDNEQ